MEIEADLAYRKRYAERGKGWLTWAQMYFLSFCGPEMNDLVEIAALPQNIRRFHPLYYLNPYEGDQTSHCSVAADPRTSEDDSTIPAQGNDVF